VRRYAAARFQHREREAAGGRVARDRLRDRESEPSHHPQRQHVLLRQVVDDVAEIVGDHGLIEQPVGQVLLGDSAR
jgi:hypothetical protein